MNLKKKLAVFLAILFSLNLFAQAPGETITISFQNIPLSEAIKKIESVSKYTFFYDALKLNVDQKVSLNAQKTPIQQARMVGSFWPTGCRAMVWWWWSNMAKAT